MPETESLESDSAEDEPDSEQPDMADDMAEFADPERAREIEAEARPETDRQPWDEADEMELEVGEAEVTVGDIYCNLLCVLANQAAERKGGGEPIFETDDGELDTTLAQQLQLDTYVNQIASKRGTSNMSPEQALVVSTCIFFAAVLVSDTELLDNLMNRAGELEVRGE